MEDPGKSASLMWGGVPRGRGSEGGGPRAWSRARRAQPEAVQGNVVVQPRGEDGAAGHAAGPPSKATLRRLLNAARMEAARATETPRKAAERRARNAAAMQAARAKETPRQAAARRANNAARMERLRAMETPEQAAARRAVNAARMQAARAREALTDAARGVGVEGAYASPYVFLGVPSALEDVVVQRTVVADNAQQATISQLQHHGKEQLRKQPRALALAARPENASKWQYPAEEARAKQEATRAANDRRRRKRVSFENNL